LARLSWATRHEQILWLRQLTSSSQSEVLRAAGPPALRVLLLGFAVVALGRCNEGVELCLIAKGQLGDYQTIHARDKHEHVIVGDFDPLNCRPTISRLRKLTYRTNGKWIDRQGARPEYTAVFGAT
jgi:hypothetical protein